MEKKHFQDKHTTQLFDISDLFAIEAVDLKPKLCKYKDYIPNRIQNSFQGVTRPSQNGDPDFKGNFISLVFSASMRKTRLWSCLIREDNRGRM